MKWRYDYIVQIHINYVQIDGENKFSKFLNVGAGEMFDNNNISIEWIYPLQKIRLLQYVIAQYK